LAVCLDQIQSERVNFNLLPPPVLNMLLRQKELLSKFDLSSLRAVCSGSAPLAPWMVQGWQNDYGISIINYFGSNEGVALASSAIDVPDAVERASYFPRFGVAGFDWAVDDAITFETRLRDPVSGEIITTPGREGELCIRGATVFEGYFKAPEMTLAAFDDDGFFRTGDLFVIAGSGPTPRYYQFVGRCKEIIIRGGQNISPAEMDNLIASHPAVAEAACVGLPDEAMGERLCAAIVVRQGAQLTLEDLNVYLKERQVAIYKWPERLLTVQQLPRNPVGKVVRDDLRRIALEAQG
jgi:acyl-CoA synthetase (AMP-forming)/AMP-acid ligase II